MDHSQSGNVMNYSFSFNSKSWVMWAVLPSITDAEQYFSADRSIARLT